MNPLLIEELAEFRQLELRRQAAAWRVAGTGTSPPDHRWRRGLGEQLEGWGRRLQASAAAERGPSRSAG